MSRVGKKIIPVPKGVEIKQEGEFLMVKGPKGELKTKIHPDITVENKDGMVSVKVTGEDHRHMALWGLFGALVANMVEGAEKGFTKSLEINGIGFKAAVKGKKLVLEVGFSHSVEFDIPEGIIIKTEENKIHVSGIDRQLVGNTAAQIRTIKKPEPYKGKGIKYTDEVIRRKAGKAAKGAAS